MIKHYLKHAYKFILRDKFHSFLNIIGLAIGITISIITLLFVQNEFNYDGIHEKSDRIYLFGVQMTIGDRTDSQRANNRVTGPLFKNNIPGIESFVRFRQSGENLVKANNKFVYENEFIYTDSAMFQVFTNHFYSGIPETCLKDPNTIVLTKSIALKYFNSLDPIGEIMTVGDLGDFKVTAVVDDPPENSQVSYEALLSFSSLNNNSSEGQIDDVSDLTSGMSCTTYFLLEEGVSEEDFHKRWQNFYDQNIKGTGIGAEQIKFVPILDNLKTYYLDSKINPDFSQQNRRVIDSFIYIGIFILLLACINYINMATSRAGMRAKEIGLKKVLGSQRIQIVFQLLGESFITTLIAFIIAFGLSEYILGFTGFNDVIDRELQMNTFSNPLLMQGSILLLIIVSIFSGIYPALYLSGLKPIKALKSDKQNGGSKSMLRNALIVIQFGISIMVITLAFLMNSQLNFIIDKDLGFKKENILLINIRDDQLKQKVANLKNELVSYSGINAASFSYSAPSRNISGYAFGWETEDGEEESHAFRQMVIDKDFYATLDIEILKGQNFYRDTEIREVGTDIIVNEALVKFMGWTNPIGKKSQYGPVIGVVKDFNFSSLYHDIRPMYSIKPFYPNFAPEIIIVNISDQNFSRTMSFIEEKWNEFAPNHPFNYTFMDNEIAEYYEQDQQQKKMSNIFSMLCILISCLGLFGLTSYITMKRKKEVAIRQTFGAGIRQIIATLFKNIFYLIIIASVIAAPFTYLAYSNWIEHFAFHVPINYLIFLWTCLSAISLAFIISLYHYLKVVNTSIIKSLRYE